jgi:ATP-binding cassette subfamily B protein
LVETTILSEKTLNLNNKHLQVENPATQQNLHPDIECPCHELSFTLLLSLGFCWLLMELSMRSQGIVAMYAWPEFRKNIRESVFIYTQGHAHNYFANHFAGSLAKSWPQLAKVDD